MADYKKNSVHVHSTLCDGKNSLEEMASAACGRGLETLGFSGHSYTPCDREYCMTPGRTAQYKATIAKLKQEYKGKLDILCGIEWDLFSTDDPLKYDYWIGSAHYIRGPKTGKYYEIDWRQEDLDACVRDEFDGNGMALAEAYYANVIQLAAKKPTILGHLDKIKKANEGGRYFDENSSRYRYIACGALDAARANGCVLELNTSGVYRGFCREYYPSFDLLREWSRLGGKITITDDAHRADALTYGYEDAARVAKQAGFDTVEVFTASGWQTCEI